MINCHICNSKLTNKLLKWKKKYNLYICNKCNLIFSHPQPTGREILDFYKGFLYNKPDNKKIRTLILKKKKEIIKIFNLSQKNIAGKSFLDYGGGTGVTYQATKELGFDVYYQEIDEKAINFVKKIFGIENYKIFKNINSIKEKNLKFDFILCDNVIEHVKQPINLAKNLFNLLKRNGILIFKTPNGRNTELIFYPEISILGYFLNALKYNSLKKSVLAYFKRIWTCDPPRHLYAFSKPNLIIIAKILKIYNFKIEYYHSPLFKYFFYSTLLKFKSIKDITLIILFSPVLFIGLLLKIIQLIMRIIGGISPIGIILKIRKLS